MDMLCNNRFAATHSSCTPTRNLSQSKLYCTQLDNNHQFDSPVADRNDANRLKSPTFGRVRNESFRVCLGRIYRKVKIIGPKQEHFSTEKKTSCVMPLCCCSGIFTGHVSAASIRRSVCAVGHWWRSCHHFASGEHICFEWSACRRCSFIIAVRGIA